MAPRGREGEDGARYTVMFESKEEEEEDVLQRIIPAGFDSATMVCPAEEILCC